MAGLRDLLATRKLRYARLLVSVTERKHGANHLSDSDLREINSNTGSSQRRDTRGPEETVEHSTRLGSDNC